MALSTAVGVGRTDDAPAPVALREAPVAQAAVAAAGVAAEPVSLSPAYQPYLTFEGGVNFLKRRDPHRGGLIGQVVNLDTDEVARSLTTNTIDYRFEAAPDLTLRIYRGECSSFSLRYFGTDSMEAGKSLLTQDNDPIGTRTPVSPFGFVLEQGAEAGGIEARANSYFHSVQAGWTNILSDDECRTVSSYVGFRYIYFRDALAIERAGTVDNEEYGWAGTNNLIGLETGLDVARHYGFITLGAKGKIGGYLNEARLKGAYSITIGTQPGFAPTSVETPRDEFSGFSGVVDLGLYARVIANQHFALRFGYDFLLMTNLVLGTDNMQPTLITVTPVPGGLPVVTPGSVEAHGNSTMWLHGLSVLMEVTW